MSTTEEARRLADSAHLGYRVGWQRQAAATLRAQAEQIERLTTKAAADRSQTLRAVAELNRLHSGIERLQAERDAAQEHYMKACGLVAQMHMAAMGQTIGPKRGVVEDVADVRAERDALRADAERYRWLRDHGDRGCTEKDGYGGQTLLMGQDLDAAIDAALAAKEPR